MVKKKRIKEGDILYISEFEKPLSKPKSNPLFTRGLGYLKNIPIDTDTFSIEVLENLMDKKYS